MFSLVNITSALAASVFLLLGCFIFFNGVKKKENVSLSLYFLALGVWGLGVYGLVNSLTPLDVWLKVMAAGIAFFPSTYLIFVLTLLKKRTNKIVYGLITISTFFLCSVFTPYLYKGVTKVHFGYVGDPNFLFGALVLFGLSTLFYGQYLLRKDYTQKENLKSKKMALIYWSFWILWIGILSVLPTLQGFIVLGGFPFWNFTNILYAALITQAVMKYNFVELEFEIEERMKLYEELEKSKAEVDDYNKNLEYKIEEQVKEIQKKEEYLQKMQQQASQVTLTMGIAHELKNPLAIMIGSLENYNSKREKDKSEATLSEYLEYFHKGSLRLSDILDTMLEFAKTQSYEKRIIYPDKIIDNAMDMVNPRIRTEDIKVSVEVIDNLAIEGSPALLAQSVVNILVNALDAISDNPNSKKKINIDVSKARHTIRGKKTEYVVMSVQDTGKGMTEDERKKIFDSFQTTKYENVGLGLTLTAQFIHKHDGIIEVDSEKGIGTTFRILLPVHNG
ncbi:GHKL domain-containing protein [bacterium]|jgi:signal transduction histidine kinase|nr:GHKL domain-containing protein [bacterium]